MANINTDGASPCGYCHDHLPSVAFRRSWIRHRRRIDDRLAVAEAKSHAQAAALQSVVCKTPMKV